MYNYVHTSGTKWHRGSSKTADANKQKKELYKVLLLYEYGRVESVKIIHFVLFTLEITIQLDKGIFSSVMSSKRFLVMLLHVSL